MTDAAVAAGDLVQVVQRDGVALVPIADLPVPQPGDMAALGKRVAAVEARPGNVPLAAALPVATVQVGTAVFKVPCKGLLPSDRVGVQPAAGATVPPGLMLCWARPDAADVLAVGVGALAAVAVKAAIPLDVTAVRAP